MFCQPVVPASPGLSAAAVGGIVAGVALAVAAGALAFYFLWFGFGHTPAFVRTLNNARKRIKGTPQQARRWSRRAASAAGR
jgi:hypothetical protein